jgi:xylitol oxidase
METGNGRSQQIITADRKRTGPYQAKPHWGKIFTMSPEVLESRYEKLADFKKLAAHYDPKGKFRNDFLSGNLYRNG